ncbi:MAG: hypothetical protein WB660_15540 [Candidatus Sulfotelmatobacter sp.]
MTRVMSFKGCTALAWTIIVASVLASGNSLIPVHAERSLPLKAESAMPSMFPARMSEGCTVFRSTLVDTTKGNTVIRLDQSGSRSIDLSNGPESLASLPESGSGILLGIGFLVVVPLAGRQRTR